MNKHEPLTRDEVKSVIQGRSSARRVPMNIHFWVHTWTFGDRESAVREILKRYPIDIQIMSFRIPYPSCLPEDYPEYSKEWIGSARPKNAKKKGLDERTAMGGWSWLDEFIAKIPSTDTLRLFANPSPDDGRYRMGHWWFGLFERHWALRGMENALMDYYLYPAEVHRLFQALTDFYIGIIERGCREHDLDGIFMSDDLGTQTGPFFSHGIFMEFFKPYFKQIFGRVRELGMQSWLHACGNVEPFIPEWIDTGLDVLHPIQKHTMDEKKIAANFGDKITVFAGFDVQQVIPWGTPEEVREEVRFLLDTYWRPGQGKCILTAGNGINQDCTLESLEAFFEEALSYGTKVVET